MYLVRILVIVFLWSWLPAWAQDSENLETPRTTQEISPPSSMELQADTTRPAPHVEDYGSAVYKMLGALVGLILIIAVVVWVLRSLSRGRFSRGASARRIEIIERRSLSPKSVLYLVEVDGARVLIAESQLEVRPLYQGIVHEEKD